MRSLTVRLQALLLLLTLVGGSLGLPVYDAVVYHSTLDHAQSPANSVTSQTAFSSHSLICAIDLATRCGTGIAPFADITLTVSTTIRATAPQAAPRAYCHFPLDTTHSRAPPLPLS